MPARHSLEELKQRLRRFSAERDWEQFHSPKNLSMALIVEAAELVEHFQWLTQHESTELGDDQRAEVRKELADILIYLVRLGDRLEVDLLDAAFEKMDLNAERYPAEAVRGRATKPTP